jgi:hypothetical protein
VTSPCTGKAWRDICHSLVVKASFSLAKSRNKLTWPYRRIVQGCRARGGSEKASPVCVESIFAGLVSGAEPGPQKAKLWQQGWGRQTASLLRGVAISCRCRDRLCGRQVQRYGGRKYCSERRRGLCLDRDDRIHELVNRTTLRGGLMAHAMCNIERLAGRNWWRRLTWPAFVNFGQFIRLLSSPFRER